MESRPCPRRRSKVGGAAHIRSRLGSSPFVATVSEIDKVAAKRLYNSPFQIPKPIKVRAVVQPGRTGRSGRSDRRFKSGLLDHRLIDVTEACFLHTEEAGVQLPHEPPWRGNPTWQSNPAQTRGVWVRIPVAPPCHSRPTGRVARLSAGMLGVRISPVAPRRRNPTGRGAALRPACCRFDSCRRHARLPQ